VTDDADGGAARATAVVDQRSVRRTWSSLYELGQLVAAGGGAKRRP